MTMTSRANMHAPSPEPRVSTLWRIPTAATLKSKSFWIGDYVSLVTSPPCTCGCLTARQGRSSSLGLRIEDYAALLNPRNKEIPFFGPNEPLPVLLAVILGVQHALAMLGGLVVPPLLIGGSAGAALSADHLTYLISASLIWCGFGTFLQISRISLGKGYYLGSGAGEYPFPITCPS